MNIYRKITFYNNFVPPSGEVQGWDYEALGYYDGIDIGEASELPADISLNFMWEDQEKRAGSLGGRHTSQMIHVFRSESQDEVITDQRFWEGLNCEDEYPFLFVTMMRLNAKAAGIKTVKREMEKNGNSKHIRLITYLTLDNNDMVVIIRSQTYRQGTMMIDQFHRQKKAKDEKNILYDSFSVCGIKKRCLNSLSYQFPQEEGMLERVCLRVIERTPGSIVFLCNALEKAFDKAGEEERHIFRYPVLGSEDEVLLLTEIPAAKFWRLYQDLKGILSNSNSEVYQKSVIGITTLILQEREERDSQLVFSDSEYIDYKKKREICEKLRRKIAALHENAEKHEKMYYKALLQILNSLQKYENMDHMDYTYIALYMPLQILEELMEDAKRKKEPLSDLSSFFYAVNLLTQNSIRLERQFTQSVELNARIYEAPVQLSTFYSVYFSLLRNVLNQGIEPKYKYEFMICPGMVEYLNVKQLLPKASREKNLLLVEIPEHKIYDVPNMLVVTAHEAAHFVGRDIRAREIRYDIMMEAIVKSISTLLVLDPDMNRYCEEKSVWQFEEEFLAVLKKQVELYCKRMVHLSKGKRTEADQYHTEYMKEDLWICTQAVLSGNEELFDIIGGEAFYQMARRKEQEELEPYEKVKVIQEFKKEFANSKTAFLVKLMTPSLTLADERCISNIVDSNIHFLKEPFADMMSILLLDLNMKDFFESFFAGSGLVLVERERPNTLDWRIALVTKAMYNTYAETGKEWSDEKLEELAKEYEKEDISKSVFVNRIQKLIRNFLCEGKNIFDIYEEFKDSVNHNQNLDRLYNPQLGALFCDYLKECYERFYEKWKINAYHEAGLSELQKIYQELKRVDDIEDYIRVIRTVIERFAEKYIES